MSSKTQFNARKVYDHLVSMKAGEEFSVEKVHPDNREDFYTFVKWIIDKNVVIGYSYEFDMLYTKLRKITAYKF